MSRRTHFHLGLFRRLCSPVILQLRSCKDSHFQRTPVSVVRARIRRQLQLGEMDKSTSEVWQKLMTDRKNGAPPERSPQRK